MILVGALVHVAAAVVPKECLWHVTHLYCRKAMSCELFLFNLILSPVLTRLVAQGSQLEAQKYKSPADGGNGSSIKVLSLAPKADSKV